MVTGKLLPVHKWNLNKEASSLPQLLNAFLHTCPLPDRACWTTTYIPLAFNCHSNLKYPSLLLHAVNWKSPLIVSCRVALLETPETPPLPCTWLQPLLTSTSISCKYFLYFLSQILGTFFSMRLESLISKLFNFLQTYITLFPISLNSVKNKVKRDQVIFLIHERTI